MIFCDEAPTTYYFWLANCRRNQPMLLTTVACPLQYDGICMNDGAAAFWNLGKSDFSGDTVLRKTPGIGADVMGPKKRHFICSRLFTDAIAVLLSIPHKISGLRQIAVVSKSGHSRLKKRGTIPTIW